METIHHQPWKKQVAIGGQTGGIYLEKAKGNFYNCSVTPNHFKYIPYILYHQHKSSFEAGAQQIPYCSAWWGIWRSLFFLHLYLIDEKQERIEQWRVNIKVLAKTDLSWILKWPCWAQSKFKKLWLKMMWFSLDKVLWAIKHNSRSQN